MVLDPAYSAAQARNNLGCKEPAVHAPTAAVIGRHPESGGSMPSTGMRYGLFLTVSETANGRADLNGDGDGEDVVILAADAASRGVAAEAS